MNIIENITYYNLQGFEGKMRLKQPAQSDDPCDMFRSELIQMIDPEHELVQLSHRIHWKKLDQAFG